MQSNTNNDINRHSHFATYSLCIPLQTGLSSHEDGVHFNFARGVYSLTYMMEKPTSCEIDGVRHGEAEFALVKYRDILIFLSRFGNMNWADAPYSWWINPPEVRTLPGIDLASEMGIQIPVKLVDRVNGLLMGTRNIILSPEFTRVLCHAIAAQTNRPAISRLEYDKQIDAVFATLKTKQLLPLACARCKVAGLNLGSPTNN